jgi:ABC-type nitrate/sulfonate/bicarbonate transport system permease component
MAESDPQVPSTPTTSPSPLPATRSWQERVVTLRDAPSYLEGLGWGAAAVVLLALLWWALTAGENPILDSYTLPSIKQTWLSLPELWFQRELSISAITSLARVLAGFLVSAAVAVPLGVIAGSYLRVNAFLKPLSLFGRNVPIAALIPLTLMWFGIDEVQKVMFIFLATVSFVLFDTTNAVQSVHDRFLDTGYTLGVHHTPRKGALLAGLFAAVYTVAALCGAWWMNSALTELKTWTWILACGGIAFLLWYPIMSHQALRKVLLPLALPDIANSLRLIFGLAFGYIMLAEVINARHGLGSLIIISQRQGPREHIYLCLIIISLMAWAIDRIIMMAQRHLFPYMKHGQT